MATSEQQLDSALKVASIAQRCNELSNSITASRNLLNHFKPIVEDIFNREADSWKLKNLTKNLNAGDYDAVVSFLHPEGILFALIKSLMSETTAKFEFPAARFPPCFRSMIENGTAPPFFANKIISTSYVSASHLILNPFEYYMFNFGLYILEGAGSNCDSNFTLNNEPAYFTLLRIYLNHFVLVDNNPRADSTAPFAIPSPNQQTSLWQSLSSTTTNILNFATLNNQTSTSVSNQSVPALFKSSIFQPKTPFNQTRSSYLVGPSPLLYGQGENLSSIEWRCSTVILMLTELWFGNIPAPKTNYILRSNDLDDFSVSNIQPYSANVDQMTAVRIVIKHLHNFSNSFTYNPVGHVGNQGLAEIKQAIWTPKYPLQQRLYTFIKVAFNRWPMDYTFRQPLEAWLSYIQPWRYVRTNSNCGNDFEDFDGNKSSTLIDVPSVDNHWRNFISDNLLYYTVIFSIFIDRLLQLDLSSSRNALMLFRVIKVYSQPGFLLLLKEAEEAVFRNNLEQSMNVTATKSPYRTSTPSRANNDPNALSAKLLAPSFMASGRVSTPKRFGGLEDHLSNLEKDPDFHYVSLFSPQMSQQLSKLFVAIQKSRLAIKEFIQSVEVRSKLRNRGWFDSIKAFLTLEDAFESKDEREMYKDKLQADDYLNFATSKISQSFELKVPDLDLINSRHDTTNIPNSTCPSDRRIFFNY